MKKKKILRIITRLNVGGPAVHTILLTHGLDKTNYDSLLICGRVSKYEGDMLYYAIEKGVEPYCIPELRRELNFLKDLVSFIKIYHIIKTQKPDIIHTHTAKAGTLGRLAGILYNLFIPTNKRAKLIHTFHGHIFSGYFNKFKTKIFIFIEKFFAKFSDKIITVSESIRKELISLGISNEDKIKVIPLGFELEKFLNLPLRDRDNFLNIGIVGRLVPIKNHRLFLESAALIIKDNAQMKLRFKIIGDGQLRKELEAYSAKLDILSFVDFLGWQKDLIKVYSDLDVIALTSINEGTPVSLIEAMASGKGVVSTNVGGAPDLLGDGAKVNIKTNADFKVLERGIIVNSRDPNSFASATSFILKNSELRKNIGVCARDFVKNIFTKDRLIRDMENLYERCIEHKSTEMGI